MHARLRPCAADNRRRTGPSMRNESLPISLLLLLLAVVTADHDEFGSALVLAGLLALGREAPWRDPVAAALGASAVRMIDRVHGDAAVVRHAALPTLTAGLADRRVHVVGVRHRADRRHAAAMHQALLGRRQAQNDVILVAADDLNVRAGRTRELPALADLEFDVVDDGADRNAGDRHGIARLHVGLLGGNHLVADAQALRRQDVGQLAVLILDQRDERRAIRIVFQPLDDRRHIELGAAEVDAAIGLLVAAAAETRSDAAVVVAAAAGMLTLGQRLYRRTLVQRRTVDVHQLTLARGGRIVGL